MENQFTKPIILITSSSSTKPKSLIKLLTGTSNVLTDTDEVTSCTWQIDTKYYIADVEIYGITEDYVRTSEFNESVQALIIHMDSNKESGLKDLETWISVENDCDPEIKLLICNYCTSETKIKKSKAIEWCLKQGYELIELYPNTSKCFDEGDEDEEIVKEKIGVDRIIEALGSHVWPSLVMKNKREKESIKINQVDNELNASNSNFTTLNANAFSEDHLFSNFLTNEGADDFTELFSQLHTIKESMKSMPTSQRKQCAEQMVTAFWHAIGGDEEELSDI